MSLGTSNDEEDDIKNDDDVLEEEDDKILEKETRGKGSIRGQGRKRGRGAAAKSRGRKAQKAPDISENDISEDKTEIPLATRLKVRKRKASSNEDEKVQKSPAKKSVLGNKLTKASLQKDEIEESGQPPGGIRTSRRKSVMPTTFEEPPDSILDEEEESSLDEPSTNEKSEESGAILLEPKEEQSLPSTVEGDDNFNLSITDSFQTEDTSLPETPFEDKDDGSEAGSESEDKTLDERNLVKKRGRGRPPMSWKRGRRRKSPVSVHLPSEATSDLPDYLKEELQHAFEIYLALRSVPKIGPFLDKPSANKFGMSTYYNVIKSPMWLEEVKRKLMCHGYTCISEFIADIKLMLENCYKYWGQFHPFSRTATQIESKLEQKIDSLPQALKDKCKDYSLGDEENTNFLKMEPDDFRSYPEESSELIKNKFKNFSSKILARLLAKTVDNPKPVIDKEREEEVLAWERLHLVTSDVKKEISSSWEVAALGMFLNTAHEYFNLKKIRQFEIERMILMPKESVALSTIMTTLLSPSMIRSKLDGTIPIMSYSVWNKKLRKRVEDWFSTYYNKNGSETEVFLACGVEPQFWRAMSYVNHYEDKDFSVLTYHQRCSILKALCDNLCCTNKSVQDLIVSNSSNLFPYSENTILGQLEDYDYFYLPFWPDIRVYKMKSLSSKQINSSKNTSILTSKLLKCIAPLESSNQNDVSRSDLFEEFTLVVESPTELLELMNEVKCLNSNLYSKLTTLNEEVDEKFSPTISDLSLIYDQWVGYSERSSICDAESITYWEFNEDVSSDKGYFDVEDPEVLGKRTRKIKLSTSNMTSSSEEEDIFDRDDDGSDWECPTEKKKMLKKEKVPKELGDATGDGLIESKPKRKRPPKTPRVKKPKKASTPVKDTNNSTSSVVIKNVTSLSENSKLSSDESSKHFNSLPAHDEIVIKTEPPSNFSVKIELDDSDMALEGDTKEEPKVQVKVETKNNVKKEIKQEGEIISDVISLSSQEEDDDDVIITTPVKKMPQPVPVTPPINNIRPPINNTVQSPLRNPTPLVRSPLVPSLRTATPVTPPMNSINNPRLNFTPSPRVSSPRQVSPRMPTTPRQRYNSPMQQGFTPPMMGSMPSPRQRAMTPRGFPPVQNRVPSTQSPQPVSRSLFNNVRPNQPQTINPNSSKTITAKLTFGKRDDGSYGYLARLPDGGVINMSPQQIDSIKKKNGSIPSVISIPIG